MREIYWQPNEILLSSIKFLHLKYFFFVRQTSNYGETPAGFHVKWQLKWLGLNKNLNNPKIS